MGEAGVFLNEGEALLRLAAHQILDQPGGAHCLAALFLAGVGGALVLVNILPLVFDVGDERFIGAFTGLSGVPAQLAAVVGPSVAGIIVEAVGSQRVLFLVSVVALATAWLLLARLQVPPGM